MNKREEEIKKCIKEIESICKKYNVTLDIHEHIDYDYNESPYISGTSIVLEDETENLKISWGYQDYLVD